MRFFQNCLPFVASAITLFSLDVQARSQEPSAIRYVSTLDHAVINTPSHQVDHLSQFDVTFNLHRGTQRIKLDLEPNPDILAEDAYVQYLDAQGNIQREEAIQRHEHRVFKGNALVEKDNGRWNPVGSARIYLKRDGTQPLFEGTFSVNGDHHHIELDSTYLEKKRDDDVDIKRRKENYMIVYRDSDRVRYVHTELKKKKRSLDGSSSDGSSACEAHKLGFNADPNHPIYQSFAQSGMDGWGSASLNSIFGLSKRQSDYGGSGNSGGVNLQSTIGDTSGCPKTKKVALIGVATDCSLTGSFKSTEDARAWVISTVNSASNVYEKAFNVSLGLRNLTVLESNCPDSSSTTATPWNMPCTSGNITSRLDLFSKWRGAQNDDNAYWTLMSNCPTGSEVGLSWLGQLCNKEVASEGSDSVSGTNVVVRTSGGGWQVFAHESGHTFGAVHDCDSQTCAQGLSSSSQCCPLSASTCDANAKFIMNPSTGDDITQFSQCTIGNICSALGRNSVKSTCLSDNKGVVTITGSQCGNGIVESGEECDCGGEEGCATNSCCDAKTCKFKGGAVCDDSNDACCSKCQFSSSGTVCRPSRGQCDLQETCSGNSSTCPDDSYKPDGSTCGGSTAGLTCASGQCTSRDYQCRTLMGSLLNSNDTYACDSSSCTLTCASSSLGMNACATMNQNFLDGTPCGGGGKCSNGQCKGSSVGKEISSWIQQHKNIVIGVACGVGGVIVLSLLWCMIDRCRRPKQPIKPPPPVQYAGGWAGPMPPPRAPYLGLNGGSPTPPYPPQGYGGPPPPQGYGGPPPPQGYNVPMSSARYA